MTIVLLLIALVVVIVGVTHVRMQIISRPAFNLFKRTMPNLSNTQRQALEVGDIWWEGQLFTGRPDWNQLHGLGKNLLTEPERAFINDQVTYALSLIDDYDIVHQRRDLPPALWQYFREQGFFALNISKQYGGHEFSAYAISTIVAMLASRSNSAAVTVMAPNSLGPAKLLNHYGTSEQKQRWLPALACGDEIPCFALTATEAGSDAGAIKDIGVVCKGVYKGEDVIGIRLNWDKRYITLAPVASVIGLAFKLSDPEALLGDNVEMGVTCALIPVNHPGVETGRRHNPLGLAFMNGTTKGKDVFIPVDWIIGGPQYAGHGWRMLMECLSVVRGISLPAIATASGHMATKATTAYCMVREQFGEPIAAFEGVQEGLARMIANTYQLEAARRLTTTALDLHVTPAVATAIAKYHMTEISREVLNDAMDIQAGKGIQLGPNNYLGYHFISTPILVTIEGANILTRSLMIFGQGVIQSHPYLHKEMAAVASADEEQGLELFDQIFLKHLANSTLNSARSLIHALTTSTFANSPVSGETKRYYQHLERLSSAFAVVTDLTVLVMGGKLKRHEMISAKLGDVLSQLYMASATLKLFEDNGRQYEDLPIVHYLLQLRLHKAGNSLQAVTRRLPNPILRLVLRVVTFPLGNHFHEPCDNAIRQVAEGMLKPGPGRNRLTHLCPEIAGSAIDNAERAFIVLHQTQSIRAKINQTIAKGEMRLETGDNKYVVAHRQGFISHDELEQLLEVENLCHTAITVDEFSDL